MALNIPSNYAQVGIQFKRAGDPDPWYITYGILIEDGPRDPDIVALDVLNAWVNNVQGLYPADTQISGVQLRIGDDVADPLTLFYPFAESGLGSGTTLPQNCAVLVTKTTVRPGRTGKGRFFWPTIEEDSVNGLGQIDSGDRTTLNNAFTAVFTDHAEGVDSNPPIPMYLLHNVGVPGGDSPTEIVGLTVDPVISTQRRRLR